MGERLYYPSVFMADLKPQIESNVFKPPLTLDQQVAKLYEDESRKLGGGNPVFKDLMWRSGLLSPFKKKEGADDLFDRLKSSGMALQHQKLLMERYIEKNNKDIYKGDPTQLNLQMYYKEEQKKAA